MFNLEEKIADWRKQIFAAGINNPGVLDELENHLRDEFAARVRAGGSEAPAFDASVREIGQGAALKSEFAKVGENVLERLRRSICAIAGIPNYQLITAMNTNQNVEPGWATYLKSSVLIFPAIFIWIGSMIFVVPKLKEICAQTGTELPGLVYAALVFSDVCKNNFLLWAPALLAAIVWLEWRSQRWPRYRRIIFGVTAFSLNLFALVFISTMMVFAVVSAANLLHHAK